MLNDDLLVSDNLNQGKFFLNANGEKGAELSQEKFPSTIEEVDKAVRVRHMRSSAREIYVDHYLQNNLNVYECEFVVWRQNRAYGNFTSRYVRKNGLI